MRAIDWIEAADNYARIWSGGRSYLVRAALQQLEARARRSGFVRAHCCALVRLGAVHELTTTADGMVAIVGAGVRVPISRRPRAAFAAALRRNSM